MQRYVSTTCVRDSLIEGRNITSLPSLSLLEQVFSPRQTTTSAMAGTVDFSEVQSALDGPQVILDVRNKDEVESQGHIRGAKNVPLSELENAISLDDDEFKSQYHFDKPSKDDEIITHCMRSGSGRAQKAADTLIAQGYSHVKVYKGSFTDWKAHGGEVVMPDSS